MITALLISSCGEPLIGDMSANLYEYPEHNFAQNAGETFIELTQEEVNITKSGSYRLSGDYTKIVIDINKDIDKGVVFLMLDNAHIQNDTGAPINIIDAEQVVFIIEGNNTVLQSAKQVQDGEPSCAIYSAADTAIIGEGAVAINAADKDGIKARDDLIIEGVTLIVDAVEDGIVGKDLLAVSGAHITVNSGKDGLKSSNDQDPDKGYMIIKDSDFAINSDDDALQSNNRMQIEGGEFLINTGDRALQAEKDLIITDIDLSIESSNEGIEGTTVTIDGGKINIIATDDAINAFADDGYVRIIDGDIWLSADGDGIDSNGDLLVEGGNIVIEKKDTYADGDGGIDVNGDYTITGGTVQDQNNNPVEQTENE